MMYLKQSTSVDVPIGPFLDETDGKTAETALTITQPDVRLKKNNGNWAQKAAAQTLTHEEAGWYEVTLDGTDTDTIGHLIVAIHESGALPVWREFHVLAANVYDSLFGAATDKLDVNVEEWNTTAVPSEHTAGYPIVTIKDGTGTGEINTTSGRVDADLTHIATAAVSTSTAQLGVNVVNFGGSAGAFASGRPEVNASHFGGTAGTFASGRPEVNASHWAGTAVGSTEVRANLINIAGAAVSTSTAQLGVNAVQAGGTAWGSGAITAASIASDAITAAKIADNAIDAGAIASDAITAAKIASGAITAAKFGAGAIDATAIATDAITAAKIADEAIDAGTFTGGACNKMADHVCRRNMSSVESSSNGETLALSSVYGLVQQAQEWTISSSTLSVKKTDGTTELGTKTVSSSGTASPVVGVS